MASQGASETPKWLPKVLPRCQNDPQGAPRVKKQVPKTSKKMHRAPQVPSEEKKKHDMLRWMLGCSRGVKMVAKITSHDASEEKGPAAEGVALKIN